MAKRKATRQAQTDRVEKTRCGKTWTEASFFGFIRSGLRQISRRWPPLVKDVFEAAKREYVGSNKRQKWEYQCAHCKNWFKRTEVAADHIVPCGTLRMFEDVAEFLRRLLCELEGLQVLCNACHKVKTDSERKQKANNVDCD